MCSGQGAPGTRPPPLQALFKRCDARGDGWVTVAEARRRV